MTTQQPQILAIDDTPANLMTLGAALEDEFELQFATSGPAGIALALQSLPDLILLDVMMPEVDGFETFRRLAAHDTLRHIPVIFVSALDGVDSEVAGLSLGAADYITKPVNVAIARQRIRNLLERERLRQAVQTQAAQLRKLVVAVEQSPASVVITDLDARLEYVNPRFTEVTGYSADEVLGCNPRLLQSGLTSQSTYASMWAALTQGLPWTGELVNKRKNGDTYWEEAQVAPVKDEAGQVTHYVAVKTDITERKQAEAVFRGLFEQSAFLAGILDEQGRLLDVNSTALRHTDAQREQLIGRYFPDTPWWSDPLDRAKLLDVLEQAFAGKASSCEARHTRPSGGSIDVLFSATPIRLATHLLVAVVGVDITERKAMAEQVHQLAFYDALTGLPNRRLLDDRLRQAMAAGKRSGTLGAVMFLDLDNFKPLNDAHGHAVGDLLLKEVAKRLVACVREVDTVARFGGDEFVVLLAELDGDRRASTDHARAVAEKIRARLEAPYVLQVDSPEAAAQVSVVTHQSSASIGAVVFAGEEVTRHQILNWADTAMYEAKKAGRNTICFGEAMGSI